MKSLREALDEQLAGTTVSYADFQAAVARLMDRGIICRGDVPFETDAYDIMERIEPILEDYFSLAGFKFRLDRVHEYARLYPPKAEIPGENELEGEEDLVSGMRLRLAPDVAAAAIALRFLYGEAHQLGKIDDDGEAESSLEALVTAMETQLKREFPKNLVDRKELMRQIRSLKIARFNLDEIFDNPDSGLLIRPMITGIVHESALEAARLAADAGTGIDLQESKNEESSDASL